jgi:hypothetical protein
MKSNASLIPDAKRSSGSSVSSDWLQTGPGFDPRQRQRISLASVSRPALGPTQPPIQWVPGGLFPEGKARTGRDANQSPPSSAEVKNEQELYLLYPLAPTRRLAGQIYFLLLRNKIITARNVHELQRPEDLQSALLVTNLHHNNITGQPLPELYYIIWRWEGTCHKSVNTYTSDWG